MFIMNLITVTSKALNAYRNDPVVIQWDFRDEGRGYQTGVSELCLRARLCSAQSSRSRGPARCQSSRRGKKAGGGEGHLGSSLQQTGTPLLLDQQHQSMLCPGHGLMCFPTRRAQAAAESELSLQRREGGMEGFLQGKEQISLLIIQQGLRGQRPRVPLCHPLLEQQPQPPEQPQGCLLSPSCNTSSFQHHQCSGKYSTLKGEAGKASRSSTDDRITSQRQCWEVVCYIPLGLLSVIPMLNYGE